MKYRTVEIVIIMYFVMPAAGLMLMLYLEIYWPRTHSALIGGKSDFQVLLVFLFLIIFREAFRHFFFDAVSFFLKYPPETANTIKRDIGE